MKPSEWLERFTADDFYDHLVLRELAHVDPAVRYDADVGVIEAWGYAPLHIQRATPRELIEIHAGDVTFLDLGESEYLVTGQSLAHDLAVLLTGRSQGDAYITLAGRRLADIRALQQESL